MKNIPIIKVPENFCIAVVSRSRDESGRMELQLVNRGGVSHKNIVDLEDLPENLDRIGLVIYIDKKEEYSRILLPKKGRTIPNFVNILKQYKEKFIGVPAIKVRICEQINKRILKVRNISQNRNMREIIESVIDHLREMYGIKVPDNQSLK